MSEASARRRRAALQWIGNGSVLPASVEQPRHDSPAELYRPSHLLMRHSGRGLLYEPLVPKDLCAASAARVTRALHMFTPRGGRL
eukprot:7067565-Prymnesium_polylepis.1